MADAIQRDVAEGEIELPHERTDGGKHDVTSLLV